jgi:tRNA A-37 threonylcarbamoyl transferase component Bud32/predicted nucleotidyltransferase
MSSVSPEELDTIKKCISKVAKGRAVVAACIYGSRAAGYARPESDIDILIVLENYPYLVKYVYTSEPGMEVSALAVDKKSLERDAQGAFLGEFVAGRLLHVYEPIAGSDFLFNVERIYKRRVIIEEVQGIVDSANVLSTEILFPLEYVMFSKIKRRMLLYPSATYSYYRTYLASKRNLEFALDGYKRALEDVVAQDGELFTRQGDFLRVSEKRILVDKDTTRLKLSKRLQEFSSYFIQTYAGRRIWHLAVREAESKIRRHRDQHVKLPDFMSCPKGAYWRLPEGRLIVDSKDWLDELAGSLGLRNYSVTAKRRLGNVNSRTILYTIKHDSGDYKIAVKELAKSKAVKWAALSLWTAPVKRFKVDPLFRLGSEYKAIRYLRSLGLHTPAIEAVVLDRKLLVTQFIEGRTLADVIKDCAKGKDDFSLLRQAGAQIAKIHSDGSSLGNIKPKNVIVSGSSLYFTDIEQFIFQAGDNAWDLAQFVSWGLKNMRNSQVAAKVAREFLEGYVQIAGSKNVARLAKSRRYIESFYPVLAPSVARAIKKEIKNVAG